jgi:hypothetical protein
MTDEELKAALPSMLFTTSNLIWSSECCAHMPFSQSCKPVFRAQWQLTVLTLKHQL